MLVYINAFLKLCCVLNKKYEQNSRSITSSKAKLTLYKAINKENHARVGGAYNRQQGDKIIAVTRELMYVIV